MAPAVTVRFPPGMVALKIKALTLAWGDWPAVPVGTAESRLSPHLSPALRLQRILEVLIWLETRGIHKNRHGKITTSKALGAPSGFVQISRKAAYSAARFAKQHSKPAPPPNLAASRRSRWNHNLELGLAYWLRIHQRWQHQGQSEPGISPALEDPELRILKTFATYLMGPRPHFLSQDERALQEAARIRPELRRYLRQAMQLLHLKQGNPGWIEAVGSRKPWAQDAQDLKEEFYSAFADCPSL